MQQSLKKAMHGNREDGSGRMNADQMKFYKALKDAVDGSNTNSPFTRIVVPKCFFLNARGGTGKTFSLNQVLNYVRLIDADSIALAVAFTGIAATLLKGGRTFNSRFKFPIKADKDTTCNVSKGSGLAKLIKKCKVIVWDEAPMSDSVLVEALDRLLKDLMQNNLPFGGKVVLFSGDFRQLPCVKPGANAAQIVKASIKSSHLWSKFKVYTLSENMRVKMNGDNPKLLEFDDWLQRLGDGKPPCHKGTDYVTLPSGICTDIEQDKTENLVGERGKLIQYL